MLSEEEMARLEEACRRLPETNVFEEERQVASDPILISMSTVLSLNRGWYKQGLPARKHFEHYVYPSIGEGSLKAFTELLEVASSKRTDWLACSKFLWANKEQNKAQMLAKLVDYFISWRDDYAPALGDIEAMRKWAKCTLQEEFVGRIRGLGPRAYQQLCWYLEGKQAIKLDRHVFSFVKTAAGRTVSEDDAKNALREIASRMGITATELDGRIWSFMEAGGCK